MPRCGQMSRNANTWPARSRLFSWHSGFPELSVIARPVLRIVRHPDPGSTHPRGAVLAMGNFDGLHRGHAALIGEARERARANGVPAGVLTFEPHPRAV